MEEIFVADRVFRDGTLEVSDLAQDGVFNKDFAGGQAACGEGGRGFGNKQGARRLVETGLIGMKGGNAGPGGIVGGSFELRVGGLIREDGMKERSFDRGFAEGR